MAVFTKLAPEVLERIAFHAATQSFLGPPSDLVALMCTSKSVYKAIAFRHNTHLYADIFYFKFDHGAPGRRFSERWLTTTCLAQELRKRFSALKRIKHRIIASDNGLDDLWTAYLMMLESDGRNESQLIDWANIRIFTRHIMHHRFCITKGSSNLWYVDHSGTALALWLFWMTDSREIVREETPQYRSIIRGFLHPFIVCGYKFPSFHAPDSYFSLPLCPQNLHIAPHCTGPAPQVTCITHYSHPLKLAAPPITTPALLSYTVRVEFEQDSNPIPPAALSLPANRAVANAQNLRGVTLEDVRAFHERSRTDFFKRTPLNLDAHEPDESERHDETWYRLVSCYDPWIEPSPLRGKVYNLGSLTGSWEGRILFTNMNDHLNLVVSPRRSPHSVPLFHRPMYCTLQEHHCLSPDEPLMPGTDATGLGDDILNAWLPKDIMWRPMDEGIEAYDAATGKRTRYETYFPDRPTPYSKTANEKLQKIVVDSEGDALHDVTLEAADGDDETCIDDDEAWEDTVEHVSSGVVDIIITGQTSSQHGEAWGHFKFIGRVRSWDGLVVLLRMPRDDAEAGNGRWIFKGYVHDGMQIVGRWRDTDTGLQVTGYEGSFVLCKRGDS